MIDSPRPHLDAEDIIIDGGNSHVADVLRTAEGGWRQTMPGGARKAVPTPPLSAALSCYDGYRSAARPANSLRAQRDYSGAHTYQRVDRPADTPWHTHWTGNLSEVTYS